MDVVALKERLAGRHVVASVSGGKDSAAMSLYLTELGIEHDRAHTITSRHIPCTTFRHAPGQRCNPVAEFDGIGVVTRYRDQENFPGRSRCPETRKRPFRHHDNNR